MQTIIEERPHKHPNGILCLQYRPLYADHLYISRTNITTLQFWRICTTKYSRREKKTLRSRFRKELKCQNNKGGKTQDTSTTEKQSEEAEALQRCHNHLVTTENLFTSPQSVFFYLYNFFKGYTVYWEMEGNTALGEELWYTHLQHIHLALKHKHPNTHCGLLQLNINNCSPIRAKTENNLISHHMVTRQQSSLDYFEFLQYLHLQFLVTTAEDTCFVCHILHAHSLWKHNRLSRLCSLSNCNRRAQITI